MDHIVDEKTGLRFVEESPKYFIEWKPGKSLEHVESEAMYLALRWTAGNKTKACKLLGISLRCLRIHVHKDPFLSEFRGTV